MNRRLIAYAIVIIAAAAGAAGQAEQNRAKGFAADKTYEFGNLDHINLFNLNVNVVLPIGQTYQVSPALSYRFALTYSGNNWSAMSNGYTELDENGNPYDVTYSYNVPVGSTLPANAWNAGMGWRLSLGGLIPYAADRCTCWTYVGPDGGSHDFWSGLHSPGAVEQNTSPTFTDDGSYLRMTRVADGGAYVREVEFPDGTIHTFRESDGQITKMRDRFGNSVTITYDVMGADDPAPKWTITDGYRTHVVEFARVYATQPSGAFDSSYYDVVKTIKLAAFDSAEADYVFTYGQTGDDAMTLISREGVSSPDPNVGGGVYVPLLHSLTLPEDQTKFTMTYDIGDGGVTGSDSVFVSPTPTCTAGICTYDHSFSGHLAALSLPTGGTIAWDYQDVVFPPESVTIGRTGATGVGDFGGARLDHAVGVKERRDLDADGHRLSRRVYTTAYYKLSTTRSSHTLITTTNTYAGPFGTDGTGDGTLFSSSLNYYSAAPVTDATRGTVQGYYGLPFTSYNGSDPDTRTPLSLTDLSQGKDDPKPRYLSTKIYDAAGNLQRYSYVGYDGDDSIMSQYDLSNRRQRSERTVFNDAGGAYVSYAISVSSDFDGVGHYRTTTTDGDFPGDNRRITTTNFNKSDGDVGGTAITTGSYDPYATNPGANFTLPAAWILNTFTRQTEKAWVTKASASAAVEQTAIALSCFENTTGFLLRHRVLAGGVPAANDVISRFTEGTAAGEKGNVTAEESFGGDTQAVSTAALCSASLPSVPAYKITHTYSSGSLATSQYQANAASSDPAKTTAPNFLSVDQDIDANTGTASASRDTAGPVTNYTFDKLGRLTEVKPVTSSGTARAGWTAYTYSPRSATTPPKVKVEQKASSGSSTLTRTTYEFDQLGRVSRELRLMPDGTTSARETLYNGLGWKDKVSEAYTDAASPTKHYTTFSDYDPFGRASTITAPDNSETSFVFSGTSKVVRTVSIATGTTETSVPTTEKHDRYGRLAEVTEQSGPTSSSSTTGGDVKTSYAYDVGGRLTSVKMTGAELDAPAQTRSFEYDGRGFLMSETSPEGGTMSYADLNDPAKGSYDARGHATSRRTQGTTDLDLQFSVDAAERLVAVNGRNPSYLSGSTSMWTKDPFRALKLFAFSTANAGTDLSRGKLIKATRYNYAGPAGIVIVDETSGYNDTSGRRTDKTTTISYTGNATTPGEMRQITQHVDYNDLDLPATIGYPMCTGCAVPNISVPERNLQPTYVAGRFATIPGYVTSTSYWPSGMLHVLNHANGIADTQEADASGMPRPQSIKFDPAVTCIPAAVSVPPASQTVNSNTPVTLSVVGNGTNPTYQWYELVSYTATPVAGATSSTYTTPALTSTRQYFVRLTSDCKVVDSQVAVITVTTCVLPAVVSTTDDVTISSGQSTTLQVTASGTAPLTYQWYRGDVGDISAPVGTNSPSFATPALTTTAYYWVKLSNACGVAQSTKMTVYVPLQAPANLQASVLTGTTTTIRLTWSAVSGAVQYRVWRKSLGSAFTPVAYVLTGTTWDDTGRTTGVTYVYHVTALDWSNGEWNASNNDLATTASFTAPIAHQTLISSSQFNDLLAAVNYVRAASGLAAVTWSGILPPGTPAPAPQQMIRAAHLAAARRKMDEALQGVGIRVTPYTNPDLTGGVVVKAQHIVELEARTR